MNIGINALYVIEGHNGGTETYLRCLLDKLFEIDHLNRYFIFANRKSANSFKYNQENVQVISCPVDGDSRFGRVLYEQTALPGLARRYKLDLMHSPGFVSPALLPCRSVVTVHDLFHLHHPHWISRAKRIYWDLFIPLSLKRAWKVITVSDTMRREIVGVYPDVKDKIVVTCEGARFAPSMEKRSLRSVGLGELEDQPYFFWVGTFAKHKNLVTLVKAFAEFKKRKPMRCRLVLAGGLGKTISSEREEIERFLDSSGIRGDVSFVGRASEEALRALYQNALAFIFPSLYEGFGLPLLEAMSQGCPVICSNCGSLPEVAGEAALVVDQPTSPQAYCAAMEKIWDDPALRSARIRAGYARCEVFSFARTARQTLDCYMGDQGGEMKHA